MFKGKKPSRLLIAALPLLAVGCASTSDVVPIGNGNYEIAGHSATALSTGGGQRVKLMKVANNYCSANGKQAVLVDSSASNGHTGSMATASGSAYAPNAGATYSASAVHPGQAASADVIFKCN